MAMQDETSTSVSEVVIMHFHKLLKDTMEKDHIDGAKIE